MENQGLSFETSLTLLLKLIWEKVAKICWLIWFSSVIVFWFYLKWATIF